MQNVSNLSSSKLTQVSQETRLTRVGVIRAGNMTKWDNRNQHDDESHTNATPSTARHWTTDAAV